LNVVSRVVSHESCVWRQVSSEESSLVSSAETVVVSHESNVESCVKRRITRVEWVESSVT